jgi:hypothetical protein
MMHEGVKKFKERGGGGGGVLNKRDLKEIKLNKVDSRLKLLFKQGQTFGVLFRTKTRVRIEHFKDVSNVQCTIF